MAVHGIFTRLINPNHPKPFKLQQLGLLYFDGLIAQTGILYMGPGVQIPAKSNSWVVVFLHGVRFWRIEERS